MAKFYFKKWRDCNLRLHDNTDNRRQLWLHCYSLNFRIFTRPNGRNAAYYCTSKPENAIFGKIIWQQAKSSLSLQRPFRHNRKQKRIITRVVADAQNLTKSFWKSNNQRWKILYQIFRILSEATRNQGNQKFLYFLLFPSFSVITKIYCRDVTEIGCSITEKGRKDRSITEIHVSVLFSE